VEYLESKTVTAVHQKPFLFIEYIQFFKFNINIQTIVLSIKTTVDVNRLTQRYLSEWKDASLTQQV
jgi:hypothetical protein